MQLPTKPTKPIKPIKPMNVREHNMCLALHKDNTVHLYDRSDIPFRFGCDNDHLFNKYGEYIY